MELRNGPLVDPVIDQVRSSPGDIDESTAVDQLGRGELPSGILHPPSRDIDRGTGRGDHRLACGKGDRSTPGG